MDNKNPESSKELGFVVSGYLGIDGINLIDLDGPIIKERKKLQNAGIVTVSVILNEYGEIISKPQIIAIGAYDLQEDITSKNIIIEEIHKFFKQQPKNSQQESKINFNFLKKRQKKRKVRNSYEKTMKNDLSKKLRSKLIKVFEELMGKRPAIEIIIHTI